MATFSVRFTTEADVKRWERLEAKGKLGPRQRERLEEWRRTNGNPDNNVVGRAILENQRQSDEEVTELEAAKYGLWKLQKDAQVKEYSMQQKHELEVRNLIAEIERLQLESEGRRKVLFEKAEELRQERLRADNAEAERDSENRQKNRIYLAYMLTTEQLALALGYKSIEGFSTSDFVEMVKEQHEALEWYASVGVTELEMDNGVRAARALKWQNNSTEDKQ